MTWWIVVGITGLAVFLFALLLIKWFIPLYDLLVILRETCHQTRADIDAKLRQRRELLPQVVAVAKIYSRFESGTVAAVATQKAEAQRARIPLLPQGGGSLGFVMGWADARALGDNWPDLKADNQYNRLMATADLLTREITQVWMRYNQAAQEYNALRSSFWGGIVASISGFRSIQYLDAPSEKDQVVEVEIDDPLHPIVGPLARIIPQEEESAP